MRKIFTFVALLAFIVASSSAFAETLTGNDTRVSSCKHDYDYGYYSPKKSASSESFRVTDYGEYDETQGLGYRFEYNDGTLTVSWYNYVTTCGIPLAGIYVEQTDDMLIFTLDEVWDWDLPDCICTYDVQATFSGIAPGHYKVSFDKGWSYGEVDLEENSDAICYYGNMVTTGVRNLSAEGGVQLGISGDLLYVNSEVSGKVEIYDANGVKIVELNVNPGDTVDLTTLAKGLYTARFVSSGATSLSTSLKFLR